MGALFDKLRGKQQVFVREYMISLNASDAYRKSGYSPKHADVCAAQLLVKPSIAAAIAEMMAERASKLEIEADDVLRRLWVEATADRNGLTQHRIGACRYCWGVEHHFQWKTPREFSEAVELHMLKGEAYQANHPAPEMEGGYGYRITEGPNADCPECAGLGIGYTLLADTTKLTPEALLIYGGVKETKDGLQIIMPDRSKALELVGKHIGMFKEKLEVTGKNGGPIQHSARVVIVPAKETAQKTITEHGDDDEVEP